MRKPQRSKIWAHGEHRPDHRGVVHPIAAVGQHERAQVTAQGRSQPLPICLAFSLVVVAVVVVVVVVVVIVVVVRGQSSLPKTMRTRMTTIAW